MATGLRGGVQGNSPAGRGDPSVMTAEAGAQVTSAGGTAQTHGSCPQPAASLMPSITPDIERQLQVTHTPTCLL